MKSWGEEVWEKKSVAHGDVGVILGTGFSKRQLDKNTQNILQILDSEVLSRLEPNSAVLDIGVGPAARIAIEVARRGHKVTGCDISASTIKLASLAANQHGVADKLSFEHCDVVELNLGRTFDCIYCVETFFHIPGHLQLVVFKNFVEHLKPGGRLVVQFAVQDKVTVGHLAYALFYHSVYEVASPILKMMGRESFYTNVTRISQDEIRDIAMRVGLSVLVANRAGFFVFEKP